jgi:Tfp pilus assembly protein PilF
MILTGCASLSDRIDQLTKQPQSAGDQLLVKGIKSYEGGEYKSAAKNLQDALDAGLSRKIDSAKAHKYLAFIACGSNNTRKCRDEFRKAFEDDPNFALNAAEAGHPVWGSVYRGVKDQRDRIQEIQEMKSKEKPR